MLLVLAPGLDLVCFKSNVSLTILQFRVPTAAARDRQDRRGPSLRPRPSIEQEMELDCFKTQRFLGIPPHLGSSRETVFARKSFRNQIPEL